MSLERIMYCVKEFTLLIMHPPTCQFGLHLGVRLSSSQSYNDIVTTNHVWEREQ